MSNYTGKVLDVTFIGNRTAPFVQTFYVNVDDEQSRDLIIERLKEDGYKPISYRESYMVNGSRVDPAERDWTRPAIGYRRTSPHIRAT